MGASAHNLEVAWQRRVLLPNGVGTRGHGIRQEAASVRSSATAEHDDPTTFKLMQEPGSAAAWPRPRAGNNRWSEDVGERRGRELKSRRRVVTGRVSIPHRETLCITPGTPILDLDTTVQENVS